LRRPRTKSVSSETRRPISRCETVARAEDAELSQAAIRLDAVGGNCAGAPKKIVEIASVCAEIQISDVAVRTGGTRDGVYECRAAIGAETITGDRAVDKVCCVGELLIVGDDDPAAISLPVLSGAGNDGECAAGALR